MKSQKKVSIAVMTNSIRHYKSCWNK